MLPEITMNGRQAPYQNKWESRILGWTNGFLFVCSFHNVVTLISGLLS